MNNRKKGLWILIPLAILAVVGIVVLIIMINQKNVDPEEDKQPVVTPEELSLVVNLDDSVLDSMFPEVSWQFLDSSLNKHRNQRIAASGLENPVTFPFENNEEDLDAMMQEVYEEILRNPIYGDMIAQGLVNLKVNGDETIGNYNPWLVQFIADTDTYMAIQPNDQYDADGNLISHVTNGNEMWLEKHITNEQTKAYEIWVTQAYRRNQTSTSV